METMDRVMSEMLKVDEGFPVIKTGFPDIDDITGYLRKGAVSLLGARPGMGRGTLAAQFAANIADEGRRVAWFSNVRSRGELAIKIANVKPNFRCPQNIFLEDKVGNEGELRLAVKDMGTMHDLMIIDDLQEMYRISKKGHAIYDPARVCASLKTFARRYHIAVLLLSNLTRAPEYRIGHVPIPTDIPQWERIKEYIDSVCLFYRDGYYAEDAPDIHNATLYVRPSMDCCANLSLLWDRERICFLPYSWERI